MLYKLFFGNLSESRVAWLYVVVFRSRLSFMVVVLLCMSFLVQPIDQAYGADEEVAETESIPAESVEIVEPEPEPPVEPEPQEVVDVQLGESETDTADVSEAEPVSLQAVEKPVSENVVESAKPTSTPVNATAPQASTTPKKASTSSLTTASTEVTEEASTPTASSTIATTTTGGSDSATSSNAGSSASSETDSNATVEQPSDTTESVEMSEEASGAGGQDQQTAEISGEQIEEEPVEPAEPRDDTVGQVSYSVNDENYYQFTKQSCVPVGDGTFHCTTGNASEEDTQSVVYAKIAESGYSEIFIRTKRGEEEQITDNEYNDTAPQYDAASRQIVWQRQIDGRYQIMLYDIARGRESQLTFSRTNNMEPAVSVSGVVWQAWDGSDWEIMYYDGTYTDQITNNQSQDIGPTIEEDYILWSVPGRDQQEAKVYSLTSGEILTVSGHEGGSILNPRFVLVYDTRFDNGDVVTQTFDPETGLAQPIAATPAPEPIDIPRPDPIGEIRALINTKSTDEQDDMVKKSSTASTSVSSLDLASSSIAVDEDTLVLDEVEEFSTSSAALEPDFELTEYDLVITSDGVSTTSASSSQADAS